MSTEMRNLLIDLANLLESHNAASIGFSSDAVLVYLPLDDDETELAEIPITADAVTISRALADA